MGFRRKLAPDGTPLESVDELPPWRQLIPLGLQHVLAKYAGAVAVPLAVGGALIDAGKLNPGDLGYLVTADLFVAGIATLIQSIGFKWFGAGVALFGMVAASGVRTLSSVRFNNRNILVVAISLGIAMIPIVRSSFYNAFPDWFQTIFTSGISAGAIVAIALNLLLNSDKQRAIYEAEEKEGVSAHDAVRETPQVHRDAGDAVHGAPRIPEQQRAPEPQDSTSDSRR